MIVRSQLGVPAPGIWPFRVSPNGRSILQANGRPFFLHGDAGNSISVQATKADALLYFSDRASRGVNTVWLNMIEHRFSDNSPAWRNVFGDLPFTGTINAGANSDFTTPNSAYWLYIDWLIQAAAQFNITFLATPCYIGFGMTTGVTGEGWAGDINANGASVMSSYGNFIGNRYKNSPNIIWVMGGDSASTGSLTLTTHINNLANGIKAGGATHLFTAHPAPNHSSVDDYNQPWLDINASYPGSETIVHKNTRLARQQAVKPVFMFEASYGNEHSMTDLLLRTTMYQGLLGSGVGHVYGMDPMWYFGVNSGVSANSSAFPDVTGINWKTNMGNFGGSFLTFCSRLMKSRAFDQLTPDFAHTIVTSGYDSGGVEGVTYCPVMANGQILVAYVGAGSGSPLTVNKAQFVSATFNVNWYNVRTGATTNSGTAAFGSGTQVFTAPDANDWVLLLDDQALGLGNP
jgi:hypothetical protein